MGKLRKLPILFLALGLMIFTLQGVEISRNKSLAVTKKGEIATVRVIKGPEKVALLFVSTTDPDFAIIDSGGLKFTNFSKDGKGKVLIALVEETSTIQIRGDALLMYGYDENPVVNNCEFKIYKEHLRDLAMVFILAPHLKVTVIGKKGTLLDKTEGGLFFGSGDVTIVVSPTEACTDQTVVALIKINLGQLLEGSKKEEEK